MKDRIKKIIRWLTVPIHDLWKQEWQKDMKKINIDRLKEKMESVHATINHWEMMLAKKGEEKADIEKELKEIDKHFQFRIGNLKDQKDLIQKEIDKILIVLNPLKELFTDMETQQYYNV